MKFLFQKLCYFNPNSNVNLFWMSSSLMSSGSSSSLEKAEQLSKDLILSVLLHSRGGSWHLQKPCMKNSLLIYGGTRWQQMIPNQKCLYFLLWAGGTEQSVQSSVEEYKKQVSKTCNKSVGRSWRKRCSSGDFSYVKVKTICMKEGRRIKFRHWVKSDLFSWDWANLPPAFCGGINQKDDVACLLWTSGLNEAFSHD